MMKARNVQTTPGRVTALPDTSRNIPATASAAVACVVSATDAKFICNTVGKLWPISAQETQTLYSIIIRFSCQPCFIWEVFRSMNTDLLELVISNTTDRVTSSLKNKQLNDYYIYMGIHHSSATRSRGLYPIIVSWPRALVSCANGICYCITPMCYVIVITRSRDDYGKYNLECA